MIHDTPQIGVINGLWANALGKGGIIPIECYQFPAQNFMDLRLTGLQGGSYERIDECRKNIGMEVDLQWQKKALYKSRYRNKNARYTYPLSRRRNPKRRTICRNSYNHVYI